jgi:large subunit ribosomal protein L22
MEKQTFIATQKFLVVSPRKLRPIAKSAAKLNPLEAARRLEYLPNKGGDLILKVVKTAIANAAQKGIDAKTLSFESIQISEGPRLRRGIAVSRGQWHPLKKRMSHITVSVFAKKAATEVKKAAKKESAVVAEPKKTEEKVTKVAKKTIKK